MTSDSYIYIYSNNKRSTETNLGISGIVAHIGSPSPRTSNHNHNNVLFCYYTTNSITPACVWPVLCGRCQQVSRGEAERADRHVGPTHS